MGQMIWGEGLFGSISLSGLQTRMSQKLGMNSTSGGRPELVGGWEPPGGGGGHCISPGAAPTRVPGLLVPGHPLGGGGSSFQGQTTDFLFLSQPNSHFPQSSATQSVHSPTP